MKKFTGRQIRIGAASAALVALSGVTLANLASSALFTDSQTAGAATVTTGAVTLSLGTATFANLASASVAPGDAKYTIVTVTNSGSLAQRYAGTLQWAASNAMTQAVQVSARTVASAGATCDGTLTWGTGDVATNVTAASTSIALFGNAASGAQSGDRTLAASGAEYLCIRTLLPSASGNAVANLSGALALKFDAEQTANNP